MPTVGESLGLKYSDEELREFIERAVATPGTTHQPRFYAITGSHVYGFQSDASDIDVRGFHTVPADEYAYLTSPADEVTVNMDGTTEGFEAYGDVDLRSYELRKFGSLLYGANYNVVELVLEAPVLVNGVALEIDAVRSLVREYLPMNVPHSYIGMAKSNYYKHLDPEKPDSYAPRPKNFLYVLRGLLGAQYVQDHDDVEADIRVLAEEIAAAPTALVGELIEHKREANSTTVDEATADRTREAIATLFNAVEEPAEPDKDGYREAIDEWMRKVRL